MSSCFFLALLLVFTKSLACVASVSVRFRSKERGTKNCASKRAGEGKGVGKKGRKPPLPPPSPLFHFLALVSFFARPKPKIPFLGLSLLRNKTETLATWVTKTFASLVSDIVNKPNMQLLLTSDANEFVNAESRSCVQERNLCLKASAKIKRFRKIRENDCY